MRPFATIYADRFLHCIPDSQFFDRWRRHCGIVRAKHCAHRRIRNRVYAKNRWLGFEHSLADHIFDSRFNRRGSMPASRNHSDGAPLFGSMDEKWPRWAHPFPVAGNGFCQFNKKALLFNRFRGIIPEVTERAAGN